MPLYRLTLPDGDTLREGYYLYDPGTGAPRLVIKVPHDMTRDEFAERIRSHLEEQLDSGAVHPRLEKRIRSDLEERNSTEETELAS